MREARKTESLPEIQRHRGKGAEIDIQLSKVVSNIVGYFTVTLFDKIKDHVMSCPIKDVDPTWDYFNLRASLNMFNLCSKELVMKNLAGNKHQQEEEGITSENESRFFSDFTLRVEELILSRLWMAILLDTEFTQRDLALQYHFYSKHGWVQTPIQNKEELGIDA